MKDRPPLIISNSPEENPYFVKEMRRLTEGDGGRDIASSAVDVGESWMSEGQKRWLKLASSAFVVVLLANVGCRALEPDQAPVDVDFDDGDDVDDACAWLASEVFREFHDGINSTAYLQVKPISLRNSDLMAEDIFCWSESLQLESFLPGGEDSLAGMVHLNGAAGEAGSQPVLGVATRTVDTSGQPTEAGESVEMLLLSLDPEQAKVTEEGEVSLPMVALDRNDQLNPLDEGGRLAVSGEGGVFELTVNGDDEAITLTQEQLESLGGDGILRLFELMGEGEPEPTAEVVVTSTPAVTVDQGIPLERFDGNNGEPIILWRNEVARDLVSHLVDMGVDVAGGVERVEVMRDTDDNGTFRWMPFVKTEGGSKVFIGHMGQIIDDETGEFKDELKGVCEVNVDKLMENGIIESEDQLQLDVNYSEDDQGIKIPRYAVRKNGESLMGCTDLRLDRSLFVAFPDRLLAQDPPLVPDFPDLPEGVLVWVPVFDNETGQWLLMEDIGGDPSFVVGEEWEGVQDFNVIDRALVSWNEDNWTYERQGIAAAVERVEEQEDGRWGVVFNGELRFFVSKDEDGNTILSGRPAPTSEPTPIPTATPVLPTPMVTLEATQPPLPPTLVPTLPPPPPTLVPTEVPPPPEQGGFWGMISSCPAGVFPEASGVPVHSYERGEPYGLLVSKDGTLFSVSHVYNGEIMTSDISSINRVMIRTVHDRSRYPLWNDSWSHEVIPVGEVRDGVAVTAETMAQAVSIGSHVWIRDFGGGRRLWIYCDG